ncbi:MAG: hypothetical protein WEE36_01890 [Acidimicrobiia bacterium]
MAGVGGLALFAGVLLFLGVADTDTVGGQTTLILVAFGAQFFAGHVAARVATRARPLNGGLAGLTLYLVIGFTSIATGEEPGVAALAFGAMVALVMGTAAGVLAESARR